ncbi:HPr family phosphocarrier protein [Desulfothermus okinawensis JCM 13304]
MKEDLFCSEVIINNNLGIHARPAALLAKEASKYKCDIKIVMDETEVDAKSILDILTLAASKGKSIKLVARGEDAKEAIENISSLIEQGFGEL